MEEIIYTLKSIKISTIEIDCTYDKEVRTDELNSVTTFRQKTACVPHPDMYAVFDKFGEIAKKMLGANDRSVVINEAKLSGKGDTAKIALAGYIVVGAGLHAAFKLPKIAYGKAVSEMQQEVDAIVVLMQNEFKAFLDEGKRADEEIFGNDD